MLNQTQELFFQATLRGDKPEQAAIAAGLKSPKAAGFRMRKHPAIVEALAAVGISTAGATPGKGPATAAAPVADMQLVDTLPRTEDAQEFLIALMNDPKAGIKARLEAAKALQPFQHARIGEKGKKETKADGAKQAATGTNAYATRKPPKLTAVSN